MTLCPVAMAIGCKKCPVVAVCPLKGVVGDYTKPDDPRPQQPASEAQSGEKRQK
ncbi:MAG TPA: hypothetical protein VMH32_03990 [Burkholderiales bacterium]|nr:hypothetical protein [Burkholderiales bacterium]